VVASDFGAGVGNRPERNRFPWDFDSGGGFLRALPVSERIGKLVSNDDPGPEDAVSTDLAGLSIEECELLRRNTTGRFAGEGEETNPLPFLLPVPELAALFSAMGVWASGEGG
jgi:hypothetical protein